MNQEQELAREKAGHEKLVRSQQQQQQHLGGDHDKLAAKVGALETRLASLQSRCAALQSRLDVERGRTALEPVRSAGGGCHTAEPGEAEDAESPIFPTLVQITLLLRNALALDRSEVPASEAEVTDQVAYLSQTREGCVYQLNDD